MKDLIMSPEELMEFTRNSAHIVTDVLGKLNTPPDLLPLIGAFLFIVYCNTNGWSEEDIRQLFESAVDDFYLKAQTDVKVIPFPFAINKGL